MGLSKKMFFNTEKSSKYAQGLTQTFTAKTSKRVTILIFDKYYEV